MTLALPEKNTDAFRAQPPMLAPVPGAPSRAPGLSISMLAVNFDYRDHLSLISEFLALHAPKEREQLYRQVTVSSDLDDWRVVTTSLIQTEARMLGLLSFEYLEQESGLEVIATFIPPTDWTNSERKAVLEFLRHTLEDRSDRQVWKEIRVNDNIGSKLVADILNSLSPNGNLRDHLEVQKATRM